MSEPAVLLDGLGMPESPRWHEGRLWFCNWLGRQVVAIGPDGAPEVMLERDPGSYPMGWSIDWPPDGRLLTTGARLEQQETGGSVVTVAEQHARARQLLHQRHGLRLGRRGDTQLLPDRDVAGSGPQDLNSRLAWPGR
jgi:sugar lactone lactonase YvrE